MTRRQLKLTDVDPLVVALNPQLKMDATYERCRPLGKKFFNCNPGSNNYWTDEAFRVKVNLLARKMQKPNVTQEMLPGIIEDCKKRFETTPDMFKNQTYFYEVPGYSPVQFDANFNTVPRVEKVKNMIPQKWGPLNYEEKKAMAEKNNGFVFEYLTDDCRPTISVLTPPALTDMTAPMPSLPRSASPAACPPPTARTASTSASSVKQHALAKKETAAAAAAPTSTAKCVATHNWHKLMLELPQAQRLAQLTSETPIVGWDGRIMCIRDRRTGVYIFYDSVSPSKFVPSSSDHEVTVITWEQMEEERNRKAASRANAAWNNLPFYSKLIAFAKEQVTRPPVQPRNVPKIATATDRFAHAFSRNQQKLRDSFERTLNGPKNFVHQFVQDSKTRVFENFACAKRVIVDAN